MQTKNNLHAFLPHSQQTPASVIQSGQSRGCPLTVLGNLPASRTELLRAFALVTRAQNYFNAFEGPHCGSPPKPLWFAIRQVGRGRRKGREGLAVAVEDIISG